ncbi:hypothetical protein KC345_g7278 [Hortaea werneckii]|nr:hypothetical protein KC345_g7278 [Hortaea werneckii]
MRTFTVAVTALLAVLSVTFAEGDHDSVHSLAIPVSHSGRRTGNDKRIIHASTGRRPARLRLWTWLLLFGVWRDKQMHGAGRWYLSITFRRGCRVRSFRNAGRRHNPNDNFDIAYG